MKSDPVFTTTVEGATLILTVHGSVSSLADDAALSEVEAIITHLQQGVVQNVLVDFGQSPYFGSALLETLRRIWNEARQRNGKMVLCNVSTVGKEILGIAKFDLIWPIVATRQDGLQQFQKMI